MSVRAPPWRGPAPSGRSIWVPCGRGRALSGRSGFRLGGLGSVLAVRPRSRPWVPQNPVHGLVGSESSRPEPSGRVIMEHPRSTRGITQTGRPDPAQYGGIRCVPVWGDDFGGLGHLGRDARTSSGAVGFPKTASPDCAASTGQRNESSECEPTRRVMKTDPRSAPGRIRSFPGSIPVGGARSDAYQSGEVVMGASGKSGPGPRRVTAARRVTVARRSGRTAHCTDPFGTGPTRVATR